MADESRRAEHFASTATAARAEPRRGRSRIVAIAFVALAAIHVAAVRIAWSGTPLQTDSGIWAYIGWRINDGALLYRDLWDNKPPGIFYAFALVQRVFGSDSDQPLRWMDSIVTALVGGLVYATARRFAAPAASAAVLIPFTLVFCHRALADWGDNAEKFVAVFETAGFGTAVLAFSRHRSTAWWLAVGACGGAAALFKQTGVVLLLAVTITLLLKDRLAPVRPDEDPTNPGSGAAEEGVAAAGPRHRPGRSLGFLWLGAITVWGPVVAWMQFRGILGAFWRQAVVYDLGRATAGASPTSPPPDAGHWTSVADQLSLGGILLFPALVAIVWALFSIRARASRTQATARRTYPIGPNAAVLTLLAFHVLPSLAIFALAPSGYGHYLLQAAPTAAILVAWMLDDVRPIRNHCAAAACLGGAALIGLPPLADHLRFLCDSNCDARIAYRAIAHRTNALVRAIQSHSDPGQSVMVWPTDHAVSFYARRVTPLETGHSIDIFRDHLDLLDPPLPEFLARLKQSPPDRIIDWTDLTMVDDPSAPGHRIPAVRGPFSLLDPPDDDHLLPDARRLAPWKRWVRANFGGQIRVGELCTVYFRGRPWREWRDYLPTADTPALETSSIPTDPRRYPYNHAASIAEASNGDLLVAWGAGSRELGPDTVILLSRRSAGETDWAEPVVAANKPDRADANPVLFVDDRGVVWLFHVQMFGPEFCTGRVVVSTSEDHGRTWSPARPALDPICVMVRHRPIITQTGRWILPAYIQAVYQSQFWLSDDRGATWRPTPPLLTPRNNNLQPAVVELPDGSLYSLMRAAGTDASTWEGRSDDGGQSWTLKARPDLPNPDSGLELIRLRSGELVLFYNPSRTERTPMAASISINEGHTWSAPKVIASGKPQLSYPSAIQTRDGRIHLVYSHHLARIQYVAFDPEWLINK